MTKKQSIWPYALAAGLLLVIIFNFYFLSIAMKSYSSLEIQKDSPYQSGLIYQEVINQKQAFKDKKWKLELDLHSSEGESTQVLKVSDSKGHPILGFSSIFLKFTRPEEAKLDFSASVDMSQGVFQFRAPRLKRGLWLVEVSLVGKNQEKYRVDQKVWAR